MMPGKRKPIIDSLLWSAFLNGILASLISVRGLLTTDLPDAVLTLFYLALQHIGHFQFYAFLVTIPLILVALVHPSRKALSILSVTIFGSFILLVFIDYAVFNLYRFHLNSMVWNMLTGGAMEEIFVFDLTNIATVGFIIGIIVLIQLGIQFYIRYRYSKPERLSGWWIFGLVLVIQITGQSIYAWSDAWYRTEIISQSRFVPLPQSVTIKRFLRRHGWTPNIPERQTLNSSANGQFNYPLHPLQCESSASRPNILFIISDGLRFDMLNPEVMPVWSRLARQGQEFTHHISTGNATRFGVYGLFSGLYSNYWFDSLHNATSPVLIEQLKLRQYQFGFFANARLSSPEFDKALFSAVREHIPAHTAGKNVISREYEITRQARSFIETNSDNPFFGLVFFDAPHAYVYPPEDDIFQPALKSLNYLQINNATDPRPFLNRYKNALRFNDRLTGDIVATLKQHGLMDNTIIIMTGDHGQEANETRTNSWGHNSNFSKYQIQVPLVVVWPGREAKVYSHLTSHVDVVPTLMQEIFGCSNEVTDYSNGRSLFDTDERDFVLVKNWNNQAIVSKHQIQVFPKIGPIETLDYASYDKIVPGDNTALSSTEVIKAISRFYK